MDKQLIQLTKIQKEMEDLKINLEKRFNLTQLHINYNGWQIDRYGDDKREKLYVSIRLGDYDDNKEISYDLCKDGSFEIFKAENITSKDLETIKMLNNNLKDK